MYTVGQHRHRLFIATIDGNFQRPPCERSPSLCVYNTNNDNNSNSFSACVLFTVSVGINAA